jgi:putative ABC transport system permease protein
MRHAFVLAIAHLVHHRGRTTLLVLALALVTLVPLFVRTLLATGTDAMMARARATPLVVGARGSDLDLVVASLYFGGNALQSLPRSFPIGDGRRFERHDHRLVVPLHLGITAQRIPVVGTSLDYFDLRGLRLAEGRSFGILGECVLGADAAALMVRPIVTDAVDPYNLAGILPLELVPVGVLERTGTPDDGAIFVDVKTAWTILGLGHGHQAAQTIEDPNDRIAAIPGGDGGGEHVVASERLRHYDRITPENLASFHFHGDTNRFPIHALLVRPGDEKDGTLLRASFQRADEPLQIVKPTEAMRRLVDEVLRIRRLLDLVLGSIFAMTACVVGLVIALSIRLRRDELTTMVRLGAARGTIARLIVAELCCLILATAVVVALGMLLANAALGPAERLILG